MGSDCSERIECDAVGIKTFYDTYGRHSVYLDLALKKFIILIVFKTTK